MTPKVSVIVPVYKAEAYLHRCVDSLLAQTFTDFEIILINDGSPDYSGSICDEYAEKDSRIRVIHKDNGGVASARQCGIDNATGKYTIHADPDDWVEPTMLEELYNKAISERSDIVICDFYVNINTHCVYRTQPIYNENSQEVLNAFLFHKLHGSLCNKLVKRTCYTDFNIRFIEGLNICEDYLACVKILICNPRIAYLNKAFYHYDQTINPNSITHQYTMHIYKMHLLLLEELERILPKDYSDALYFQKTVIALLAIRCPMLTSKQYKEEYQLIQKQLLPYVKGVKMKLIFLLSVNGYKELAFHLLKLGNKLKSKLKVW